MSTGTVSRVLNGHPGVDPELRERVRQVARSLNYDLPRRGVDARQLKEIGFLLASSYQPGEADLMTPFWARILAGAEEAARSGGARLSYRTVAGDDAAVGGQVSELRLDGLLLVGSARPAVVESVAALGLPVGLVDMTSPGTPLDAVVSDSFGGARAAVEHLLAAGHRDIAFVGGPFADGTNVSSVDSVHQRLLGYETALRVAGIVPRPDLVAACDLQPDSTAATTRALLDRAPEVTALFCANDSAAAVVIQTLRELRLDVPGDISVIGFDDDVAIHTTPALTTVRVAKEAMGRHAVRRLLARALAPEELPTTLVMPTSLIHRRSVAPAQR